MSVVRACLVYGVQLAVANRVFWEHLFGQPAVSLGDGKAAGLAGAAQDANGLGVDTSRGWEPQLCVGRVGDDGLEEPSASNDACKTSEKSEKPPFLLVNWQREMVPLAPP